ncbi:hypothetical protein SPB_1081 [Streptococcus parauberis NCFD 2020]|uniref:DUF2785 domain-containing protein n=2 Tax=Streptococcus parauberis TaxID=1348 RepID=F1Z2L3_9STRE|nr:hypothetical protein SPB_1081 [Streptococcus parauberis NCFD 2020]
MEARDVIKSVENIYPISEPVLEFLLNHIGNPDPKIRDEVVYGAWYKLIKEHKLMQSQKLNILQRVLRDRFLLHGLGTPNNNTVLKRSFTALLLTLLLEDSNNSNWISIENQIEIMDQVLFWLTVESDFRGLDENLGWVHAFAHGADLLTEIVKMEYFSKNESRKILDIIKRIMIIDDMLLWGEEDRISIVIVQLFKTNNIKEDILNDWILEVGKSIDSWESSKKWSTFLQSLYFKIKFEDLLSNNIKHIIESFLFQQYQDKDGLLS